MTEKNIYIYPPNIPDAYLLLYDETGTGLFGGTRLHWGRLDVIRARRQPDEMASSSPPSAKKLRTRRKK